MARTSRTAIHADDPTYLWKLILRILSIPFSLAAIGCIAWALNYYNHYNYYDYYHSYSFYFYGSDFVFLPWILIPLGLSVTWNAANIATLLLRNRPIHPGANVGCDLILWLLFAVAGSFAAIGGATYLYGDYYENSYDNSYTCEEFQEDCGPQPDYGALQRKGVVIEVGASLGFVVLLFHFALFISACRYTHQRRHPMHSAPYARALTEEATEIARKMIADMTGPNGGFIPINHQQQQPLLYNQKQQGQDRDLEMQQEHQESYAIQQHNTAQEQMEQGMERRHEPFSSSGNSDANIPIAPPPEIMVESQLPSETHPAFRGQEGRERDSITYAPV